MINTVTEKSSNSMETNAMVSFLAETVSFCFKLLPFLRNPERIRRCINFFGEEAFAPKTDQEQKILDECVWICRRNSIIYFYGILATAICWNFPVLFIEGRKLPFSLWLPYDPSSTAFNYYITFTFVVTASFYDSFSGTNVDPLIGGLAYHATAQLKILKHNLQHIDKHEDYTVCKCNKYIIEYHCVYKHLERCITHHKKILWFIDEYEECFSWSIFCQFAGSLFAICFCCIGLILVPINSLEGFSYITFIIDISFQIFFYCHYGTLLYEESNDLNNAIYMGPWYKCDIKIRQILLILMERAKQPVLITAGKVVDVTVRTFLSVLKTSYSLIAVLNNYE
ncbi:odorant receptor 22a-like [Zophobas morio]|uniref:odorant receptor 22a-like n=1 Tax=Zophobas morio TaxID=2755281 RepID=UPI003083A32B